MTILTSQKQKPILAFEGYTFRVDKTTLAVIYWRCRNKNCKARVRTNLSYSLLDTILNIHNHPPVIAIEKSLSAINTMKSRARSETSTISAIYAEETAKLISNEYAVENLPSLNSIESTLHRIRRSNYPAIPDNCSNLIIPAHLRKNVLNEDFLLFKSVDKTIVIFSTAEDLIKLCSFETIYVDGTFSCVPKIYKQLYTFHGFIGDRQFPFLYCLLSNKSSGTYVSLINNIKSLAMSLNSVFNPPKIVADFETGWLSAMNEALPNSIFNGCYFHFTQSIWRKIQDLGLSTLYKNCLDINITVRQITGLGFLPIDNVYETFELIRSNADPRLTEFLNYFYDYWILTITISKWNVFDRTIRTNNNCEGWHNRFNRIVGKKHPNIYYFIECLIKDNSINIIEKRQLETGQAVNRKIKKYVTINNRIIELKNLLQNGTLNLLDFCKNIGILLSNI